MAKVSEAQRKANAKWAKKNPEKRRKQRLKSACKSYIYNYADTKDELSEVEVWLDDKNSQIESE